MNKDLLILVCCLVCWLFYGISIRFGLFYADVIFLQAIVWFHVTNDDNNDLLTITASTKLFIIQIIFTQLYGIKYFYLIRIIFKQMKQ